jgi:hypothetical protein
MKLKISYAFSIIILRHYALCAMLFALCQNQQSACDELSRIATRDPLIRLRRKTMK